MRIKRASLPILGVAILVFTGAEACNTHVTGGGPGGFDTTPAGGGNPGTNAAGGGDPGTSAGGAPDTLSSTSAGAGPVCPAESGSVCDGIFDGAPGENQPVWAVCEPAAIALGVDADGTSVLIDYDGNASLLDADGHDLGKMPLAYSRNSGHYSDWIRFSPAEHGGPSDLVVGRRYFDTDDTPEENTIERFDRAGQKLWSHSLGVDAWALHPSRSDANGNVFALVDGSDAACSLIEIDASGSLVNQAPLAVYPGAGCGGLAADATGNLYLGLSYDGGHDAHETLVKLDVTGAEVWSTVTSAKAGNHWATPGTIAIGVSAAGEASAVLLNQRPTDDWIMTFARLDASGQIVSKQKHELQWNGAVFSFDADGAVFLGTYVWHDMQAYGVDFTSRGKKNTLAVAKFGGAAPTADWGVGIAAPANAANTLDVQVDAAGNPYVWSTSVHDRTYVARMKPMPSCAP